MIRDWLRRVLLFFFAYLAGYLVHKVVLRILVWLLLECGPQVLPKMMHPLLYPGFELGRAVAFSMTAGFAYCILAQEGWRRAGAVSWLVFTAINTLVFSRPDALTAAGGAVAAFAGAWMGERHRWHPNVATAKEFLLDRVILPICG